MKKLYMALALALVAVSAGAANLIFYLGDKEIAQGSTVGYSEYEWAEEFEPGVWDIMMKPKIYLESDFFTNTVTITATCTSGHKIQMCCGGQCMSGETVTKSDLTLRQGVKFDLEFDYMNMEYEGEQLPVVTTVIEAVDGAGTPVSFTIVMGPEGASIENAEIAADQVRYTAAGIEYDVTSACSFSLYSLIGTQVMSATLEGRGTLSVAGLPKGVYVYTLDGKAGKVLVK